MTSTLLCSQEYGGSPLALFGFDIGVMGADFCLNIKVYTPVPICILATVKGFIE